MTRRTLPPDDTTLLDPDRRDEVENLFRSRWTARGRCWLWTDRHRRPLGADRIQATFCFRGRAFPARRVSWLLHRGEIPEGYIPIQTCRNRHCVRPDHLALNQKYAKKLSEAEIRAIREADLSPVETAKVYGVSQSYVCLIRGGKARPGAGGTVSRPLQGTPRKLSGDDVRDIVRRYKAGGETLRSLGAEYGVSGEAIRLCVIGRRKPTPGTPGRPRQ